MADLLTLFSDPTVWAALITLIVLEVVLGIDNLVFVSILSNKLPPEQRTKARRIGIGLALVMRLALLSMIAWIVGLTAPVFDLGFAGAVTGTDKAGEVQRAWDTQFSWRDLILIAGGLFLVWKATTEIHQTVDPRGEHGHAHAGPAAALAPAVISFGSAIAQIILLDLVFSIDSILTAVGMTDDLPVMVIAVVFAVLLMLVAADPLANFINRNPSVVMLALGFLLMIGMVLIAEGFGAHVPKGYIYTAMGFSAAVESLNLIARRRREAREGQAAR